jgi:dolichol-phosphate mannosyltransferase
MTSPAVISVVIPAYNEERFIGQLLEQIQRVDLSSVNCRLELIVIDDGSKDRTADIVAGVPGVTLLRKPNGGKGSAVRAGIGASIGDYVLIQDADLEYDPRDYVPMLQAIRDGATVVYGSRYLAHRGPYPNQGILAYLGGISLSVVCKMLTGIWLTDTVTAYKLFPRTLLTELALETSGFELDHEITAKVAARGHVIREVPIHYAPRSRKDGKKIGARDWVMAVRTFSRWRRG